jgi:hypothetical protein
MIRKKKVLRSRTTFYRRDQDRLVEVARAAAIAVNAPTGTYALKVRPGAEGSSEGDRITIT